MSEQPPERHSKCAKRVLLLLVVLNLLVLAVDLIKVLRGVPVSYCDDEERAEHCDLEMHFKYGSVGSDNLKAGLPYWFFKTLPDIFPTGKRPGYESFGIITEQNSNMDRPMGFSKRRIGLRMKRLGVDWGVDMVGINCALCHASAFRKSWQDPPHIVLGMPGQTVDAEGFFVFLFTTARDPEFTPGTMFKAINEKRREELHDPQASMGWGQRVVYWGLTYLYRWEIGKLEKKFCFLHGLGLGPKSCWKTRNIDAGPGRIDTWAPYKVLRLQAWTTLGDLAPDLTFEWAESIRLVNVIDMPIGDAQGFADAASIWNLQARMGQGFHWDGNTTLLSESSITAAVGAGATPAALDRKNLDLIARWAKTLAPPQYDDYAPKQHDAVRSETGKQIYFEQCASCHSPSGHRFGMVEPIENLGTDRNRLDAFTNQLAAKLKTRLGKGYGWQFRQFRTTIGYSNMPLDGIWLRAPYLHNGSVPTLRDLLKKPTCRKGLRHNECEPNEDQARPDQFCRGNDQYEWDNVGFQSELSEADCKARGLFWYDTKAGDKDEKLGGNGNQGHLMGTNLPDEQKKALLEYLKTL